MKKQLLALSMVTTSGLIAQPDAPMHKPSHNQSNTCSTCCCFPCCCSNPRPCIDCECYVPQFYNLQCDWGFSFDAEFLYWYARETNLAYASKIEMKDVDPSDNSQLAFANQSYKHLDTDWNPGFRIGIGYNSSCDGWDYNLTWTWFSNKEKDSTCVPDYGLDSPLLPFVGAEGQSILLNPWINQSFHFLSGQIGDAFNPYVISFDRISAKYHLTFNQVDLDVGRRYWLSKCLNMRPYVGLRGAWTRARFSTNSYRTTTVDSEDYALMLNDKFKSKGWGVGFIAGFEPTFYFSQCFGLFAKAGTGVIWGDFEVDKTEKYSGTNAANTDVVFLTYCNKDHSEHSQMTGLLDLALGIRWESTWCCDRYRSAVDLGWEHHIFFDQNHRYKTVDFFNFTPLSTTAVVPSTINGYRQIDEATGNLGFGGFVLRLNFDF